MIEYDGTENNMANTALLAGDRWLVRVVKRDDRYGLNDCLVHDEDDPLVEFYDAEYRGSGEGREFGPRGQFVARYYWSTLCKRPRGLGLDLLSYEPKWKLEWDEFECAWRLAFQMIDPWGWGPALDYDEICILRGE